MSKKWTCGIIFSILAVIIQATGLFLFVCGFFPAKAILTGFSGIESYKQGCYTEADMENLTRDQDQLRSLYEERSGIPTQFDRLVFMVIDGLPAEFVLGKEGAPPAKVFTDAMPFMHSLLSNGKAIGYRSKAAPPTVTMPRLKAMTSGAIPGFLDVAFNFHTQALLDDNLLAQLSQIGWKMVMLGDETWLKLFPGLFVRRDGVSSFYVKDTTEVDQNVSRHLDNELSSNDWDLLILHYLGLDHVGHTGGRESPLMAPKLSEMDEIIKKLHTCLLSNHDTRHQNTLMVIASDHGMTRGGNHGGASDEETDALAVFVPLHSTISGETFSSLPYSAFQVDIVPTLALLLGVPIPKNNIGVLLPQLFYGLKDEQKLRAVELNSWQILRLLNQRLPGSKCMASACYKEIPWTVSKNTVRIEAMDVKLCSLFKRAILLHKCFRANISSLDFSDSKQCLHMGDTETPMEAYIAFLRSASEFLARGNTEKPIFLVGIGGLLMCGSLVMLIVIVIQICKGSNNVTANVTQMVGKEIHDRILEEIIALCGICFHACSLGASSLVEEEQYVWHFLVSTLCAVFIFRIFSGWRTGKLGSANSLYSRHPLLLEDIHDFQYPYNICMKRILLIVFVNCAGRLLRGWHQGGVNWTSLPDIAKWLDYSGPLVTKPLQVISLLSVVSIGITSLMETNTSKVLKCFVVFNICLSGTSILFFILIQRDEMTLLLQYLLLLSARVVYASLGMTAFVTLVVCPWFIPLQQYDCPGVHQSATHDICAGQHVCSKKKEICIERTIRRCISYIGMTYILCWCLLQQLLQQPVNSFPIAILLFQLLSITKYFLHSGWEHREWIMGTIFYCLGMSGHFGLGNSNSLATVDVAGAYIGLSKHSTVISGTLAFIITYASPFLFLFGQQLYSSFLWGNYHTSFDEVDGISRYLFLKIIRIPCLLPLCLNSVVLVTFTIILYLMKDHLFIWSVFSPKYLYVCATTFCIYIVTCISIFTAMYSNLAILARFETSKWHFQKDPK